MRAQRVSDRVALLTRINAALAERGVRFIVAIPPNGATTYQDLLPIWAQNRGRRTEYDLLLGELAVNGVRAVDLRPPVEAARAQGPAFFMHDTHWSFRGALAGFNAVVEADSHPDWRLDPNSALGPLTTREGGDLARMLGFEDSATETIENLALPRKEELANRPLIREQAFGESLDPNKLERLGRYEVHLDRKLERMLSMLLRLKDLRQRTIEG